MEKTLTLSNPTTVAGTWRSLIFALVALATAFTILSSSDCGDVDDTGGGGTDPHKGFGKRVTIVENP